MVALFHSIDAIASLLESKIRESCIRDYRVVLGANNVINVYVLSTEDEGLNHRILEYGGRCVFLSEDDVHGAYAYIFSKTEKIDYRSTRIRLDNLIDQDSEREPLKKNIITFYSYKGGVGRSTLLSSYAIHLASNNKRVVVLDCDFEAPGMDNFFIEDQSAIEYSNGLVEYFLDSEFQKLDSISPYYREVSKLYSLPGEIIVFPAGNLNTTESIGNLFETDLDHYLNGLSRLNIFSKDAIVERFMALFAQIEKEVNPDVILIDSRTGFNDIFGMAALRFSNILVGLFGIDVQSRPGLDYFLDLLKRQHAPRLVLMNSIIPAGARSRHFPVFKGIVNDYLERISDGKEQGVYSVDMFPVSFDGVINNIGKPGDLVDDYVSLIKDGANPEYNAIFSKLDEFLIDSDLDDSGKRVDDGVPDSIFSIKKQVLTNILEYQPALYGEEVTDFSSELNSGRFFFRDSMADLFNGSKFLVVGNKGTGKTYLYRSLGNTSIVDLLKKKAGKSGDYLFIQAVSTIAGHSLDTVKLDGSYDLSGSDLFFERFWQLYIWSSIMAVSPFGYKTDIEPLDFSDTTESANKIIQRINDPSFLVEVEKDLSKLSRFLNQKNKKIVVAFDELDTIVKPLQWPERISPLINLCRKMQLTNITTKLFLRSDLYEKITNITNKNALNNRMIRIEWTREEIFAYFFNLVMSHSRNQFEAIVRLCKDYPKEEVMKALEAFKQKEPIFDDITLRVMCSSFFGKFADAGTSHRFGESYDWFYANLKNANDTISLRPFIDLITLAINFSIRDDKSLLPILPAAYYTHGRTRAEAVERHFKDLAQEKGNIDLLPIFDYIQNKAPANLKLDKMTQRELFLLLDSIIAEGALTENSSRDELIELLTVNGIMKSVYVRLHDGTHRNYHFALLYKYYLGLRSNPKIR